MAELNESQLMLLDTLVYVDGPLPEGHTLGDYVAELNNPQALDKLNYSEGLTREETEQLLNAIANDSELASLEIARSIEGEVGAACFVDGDGDAVIAYRGTGPAYVEWDDDAQGGYLSGTDMQEQALVFAQECARDYDNITVTGHSKGGNMAQYVTVLMGDAVDRCVSFDGQGFSQEFVDKYQDEINANSSKIRNVCAYNDYVNILLISIADETVYLETDNSWFPGGHYLFDLYTNEKNKLDENGEYINTCPQDPMIADLEEALDEIVKKLDDLNNPYVEFVVYSIVGIALGWFMGDDASVPEMIRVMFGNLKDFWDYYIRDKFSGNKNTRIHLEVNTDALRDYSGTMADAAADIEILRTRIQKVRRQMAGNVVSGAAVGLSIQAVLIQLDSEATKLQKLAAVLNTVAEKYDAAEKAAKGMAV